MKPASPTLITLLSKSQLYMADCYTFILADGTTVRYTTADVSITDAATGHKFLATGPKFNRSQLKFQKGVATDSLSVSVTARTTDLLEGTPWLVAMREGSLDGAEMRLDRAFMTTFGDTTAGLITMFYGRIVEIDNLGRTGATLKVNTHMELLNLQWPWRLFQPPCSLSLYDAGCTLVKASFGIAATVGTAVSSTLLNVVGPTQPAGWFSLGTLTFTSGVLNGTHFSIKQSLVSGPTTGLVPLTPFPTGALPGDTLTLFPGCDKAMSTCLNKFANLQHYEGEPFVPVPEAAT